MEPQPRAGTLRNLREADFVLVVGGFLCFVRVVVIDTVGAGDSFMSGFISGLLDAGLLGSPDARQRLRKAGWSDVQSALHNAVVTSGLTVSKHGAYAPTPDEVAAVKQADPRLS